MKHFLSGVGCFIAVLFFSIPVMANESINIYPKEPVTITEEEYAESISFSEVARGLLQRGKCGIGIEGSKRVLLTATTFANQTCSLIRTDMYLFKYNPDKGTSSLVSGPYRFATANAAYGHASKSVSVPSLGYYINVSVHTIGSETTTTQTPAVHVTY